MRRVAGILVGGAATRMGGRAKGLLTAPDGEPIVLRTARLFGDAGCEVVLVGRRAEYAALGLPLFADVGPPGPMAGVRALCALAAERIYVVACDMPYLSPALVARLVADTHVACAPRLGDHWEAMFCAFDRAAALPWLDVVGSPSALLDRLAATPLPIAAADESNFVDWDRHEDVIRGES